MDDKVMQIEVILNFLNTLFAKAVSFKDEEVTNKLNLIRHDVYHGDFVYELFLAKLQEIEVILKKYE